MKTPKEMLEATHAPDGMPPIPERTTWRVNLTRAGISIDDTARSIPYVCAQVGRLGRGQIGLNPAGEIVFYLPIETIDRIAQLGLADATEIWVVLKAPDSLTNPYHGS